MIWLTTNQLMKKMNGIFNLKSCSFYNIKFKQCQNIKSFQKNCTMKMTK
jgi:hypothetical protein